MASFKLDADKLESWLWEKMEAASDISFADSDNLFELIEKNKKVEAEIQERTNAVDLLMKKGHKLITEGGLMAEIYQTKIDGINKYWSTLISRVAEKSLKLQQALELDQFWKVSGELLFWIQDKETFVTADEFGTDLEHVEVLQRKFDEFQKEMASKEKRVMEVSTNADKYIRDGHPDHDTIRQKKKELNDNWERLKQLTETLKDKIRTLSIKKFNDEKEKIICLLRNAVNMSANLLEDTTDEKIADDATRLITALSVLDGTAIFALSGNDENYDPTKSTTPVMATESTEPTPCEDMELDNFNENLDNLSEIQAVLHDVIMEVVEPLTSNTSQESIAVLPLPIYEDNEDLVMEIDDLMDRNSEQTTSQSSNDPLNNESHYAPSLIPNEKPPSSVSYFKSLIKTSDIVIDSITYNNVDEGKLALDSLNEKLNFLNEKNVSFQQLVNRGFEKLRKPRNKDHPVIKLETSWTDLRIKLKSKIRLILNDIKSYKFAKEINDMHSEITDSMIACNDISEIEIKIKAIFDKHHEHFLNDDIVSPEFDALSTKWDTLKFERGLNEVTKWLGVFNENAEKCNENIDSLNLYKAKQREMLCRYKSALQLYKSLFKFVISHKLAINKKTEIVALKNSWKVLDAFIDTMNEYSEDNEVVGQEREMIIEGNGSGNEGDKQETQSEHNSPTTSNNSSSSQSHLTTNNNVLKASPSYENPFEKDSTFPQKCKLCGKQCKDKKSLYNHHAHNHASSDPKYKCEHCGKGFKGRTEYKRHENQNGQCISMNARKTFICDYEKCSRAFVNQGNLVRHKEVIHGIVEEKAPSKSQQKKAKP